MASKSKNEWCGGPSKDSPSILTVVLWSYLMTHKTCIFRTKFEIPVPYKSTYSKLRHVYSYLDRCLLNILLIVPAEQQKNINRRNENKIFIMVARRKAQRKQPSSSNQQTAVAWRVSAVAFVMSAFCAFNFDLSSGKYREEEKVGEVT